MKKLLLLLLLLSCGPKQVPTDTFGGGGIFNPPSSFEDCTDFEGTDTFVGHPQFIGTFGIPDHYFVCGESFGDSDYFWFVPFSTVNLNFDVQTLDNVDSILRIWTGIFNDDSTVEYTLLYEFFSSDGLLQGNSWPIPLTNHGFVVELQPFDATEYQIELWPF